MLNLCWTRIKRKTFITIYSSFGKVYQCVNPITILFVILHQLRLYYTALNCGYQLSILEKRGDLLYRFYLPEKEENYC